MNVTVLTIIAVTLGTLLKNLTQSAEVKAVEYTGCTSGES